MNTDSIEFPGIACMPDAINPTDRAAHFELARNLLSGRTATRESLPNGVAFRLPADSLEAIARFITNERKCCPFLTFDIKVEPRGGAVLLNMTGPVGTREVLEAELGLQSHCCCQ